MKWLPVVLAAVLLLIACAPQAADETPESAEPAAEEAESAAMDAEAAVDAVSEAYMAHYNQGDAPALAALFAEDAVTLFADGGVNMGPAEIEAAHEQEMVANPEIAIDPVETVVGGELALQRGTYSLQTNPAEGESTSFSGAYITELQQVDGEWKIGAVISNYDSDPPAGVPVGSVPEEAPEDLDVNPVAPLIDAYVEHFNAGHADMVAALFSEDASVALAGAPWVEGRDAVQAQIEERLAAGSPTVAIHTVAAMDMGEGRHVAGGWFELTVTTDAGETTRVGNWMMLSRTNDAGEQEIDWLVSNMVPDETAGM